MKKIFLLPCIALLCCLPLRAQETDSIIDKLIHYVHAVNSFSRYIPQEKVYLHFDNSSYYEGDNIWFKCYLVNSELNQASGLSKTLYVDLLNPGGEIVDKKILKIENGQCHGDFELKHTPFYSGFYEVRAYTKYMLNFGEDGIFSRVFPVFDKPKAEGDFTHHTMTRNVSKYPMKRDKLRKDKKVTVRFFPEGGNLVMGVKSQIAFQATDEYGNPIEVTGTVVNNDKEEKVRFSTTHNGRGTFSYVPDDNKSRAIIEYKGKEHRVDMPTALPDGYVMEVDNLSDPDSIGFCVRKSPGIVSDILGMGILCRGKMQKFTIVEVSEENEIPFKVSRKSLNPGVVQFLLFNKEGEILSDRLAFISAGISTLSIRKQQDKEMYLPHELVSMEFTVAGDNGQPIPASFSLSVKDGANEVEHTHNILTNLLLTSEIKGYVDKPNWYFESDDEEHRQALDLLLMVQGWRRYAWSLISGIEPLELKHQPEQSIEVMGHVQSFVRGKPKPNVDVSFFLSNKNTEEESSTIVELFTTDSLGRFLLRSDLYGTWDMTMAVAEKGKKKDYSIILDRLFRPESRKYSFPELKVNMVERKNTGKGDTDKEGDNESDNFDYEAFYQAYEDSLSRIGINEKIHRLDEVVVTGKKDREQKQIEDNREKSVVYYDVLSELDDITDDGGYVGNDIYEFLKSIDKNFVKIADKFWYKSRRPLFIVNYQRSDLDQIDPITILRLRAIKSIYINETLSYIARYADPRISIMELDKIYSCVVFIETYPEDQIPAEGARGVRKTKLNGYNLVREFYSPNYGTMPPEPDYRRTLYWNPMVVTDQDGKAEVRFYNNSTCRSFSVSAETVTPNGIPGVIRE